LHLKAKNIILFFTFFTYNYKKNLEIIKIKMLVVIGIIVSIIVFSIIILVHEYGHFKTARIFGVKVEEF
jgi:uncharacterized membrane protein